MANPVVHFEIAVTNAARSNSFYTQLFDWQLKIDEATGYNEVPASDGGIGGGIFQAKEGEFQPYVTVYVQVDDLKTYLDRAVKLGGSKLLDPTPIPGIGAIAMLADLDGNMIGLFTPQNS